MNAKRGYVPEDEQNFSPAAIEKMRTAARHICYLINEGYDIKQSSAFVGNHYVLSERQRLALVRSVSATEQLNKRKEKEKTSAAGCEVWIDGFNTIITLEVMFSDSILFECMDGTIRDLAALRGTYRIIPETEAAVRMLFDTLKEQGVDTVHILLDEPVSNSGRLKALIADLGAGYPFKLDIGILKEVDKTLWEKENVITADAIILDHCINWINLIKICARKHNAKTIKVWAMGIEETNMTDYDLLIRQADELTRDNVWDITLYANIAALLYDSLADLNWAGFYLLRDGELQLGPFQGKTACTRIPIGKGVCGTAVAEKRIIRVPDVHAFPGHIACDSASASEIVLPIYYNEQILGVLDIDSPIRNRFDAHDEQGLSMIVDIIEANISGSTF